MPYHEHVKRWCFALNPGHDVWVILDFSNPSMELLDQGFVWVIFDLPNPTLEPRTSMVRELVSQLDNKLTCPLLSRETKPICAVPPGYCPSSSREAGVLLEYS